MTRSHTSRFPRPRPAPRGNAIVLVSAVLVMLVIIATAYITRTRADRSTSSAQMRSENRDAAVTVIADDIARELGESLFVRLIDPFDPEVAATPTRPADANRPRLQLNPDAIRYGMDIRDTNGDGIDDLFLTYNFAPYQVVPWTNWPDRATLSSFYGTTYQPYLDNPPVNDQPGNPGFGDTRWLRDSEPFRFVVNIFGSDTDPLYPQGIPFSGDEPTAYTHWTHLTNIARADNGFRIVTDISDVGDLAFPFGPGRLVTELNFPVEQWMPIMWNHAATPARFDYVPATVVIPSSLGDMLGAANYALEPTSASFITRWRDWFLPPVDGGIGYPGVFRGGFGLGIPANLYRLSDLNNNGVIHEIGERPEDEFNGPFTLGFGAGGSARWNVCRVLADTDGDGFTDSFWFLAPVTVGEGIRTIMAISVVDNQGMLDLNAASKFMFANENELTSPAGAFDPVNNPPTATAGHTPADLALVGQAAQVITAGTDWNNGFFDNVLHQEWYWTRSFGTAITDALGSAYGRTIQGYDTDMWANDTTGSGPTLRQLNFISELGVKDNIDPSTGFQRFPFWLRTQQERQQYWIGAGRSPLDPQLNLTPFTLADELELRLFAGENYPWIASRLERATQPRIDSETGTPLPPLQFFHASLPREESSEYRDQLNNPELERDLRSKATVYNDVRNDLLPPWLWWAPHVPATPGGAGVPLPQRIDSLITSAATPAQAQFFRDNFFAETRRKLDLRDAMDEVIYYDPAAIFYPPALDGRPTFRERLAPTLRLALIDYDGDRSYFNSTATTEKAAASLAANIECYRDRELFQQVPVPAPTDPPYRNDQPLFPNISNPSLSETQKAILVDPANPGASNRFIGMERQPFIVEAFIAHVYAKVTMTDQEELDFRQWYLHTPSHGNPAPPPPGGFQRDVVPVDPVADDDFDFDFSPQHGQAFVDSRSQQTTIVVVQIANPYNDFDETGVDFDKQGIDLRDYAIRVFGKTVELSDPNIFGPTDPNRLLRPGTEERPRTAIFYSILDTWDGDSSFKRKWLDFLDLDVRLFQPSHDLYFDPANPTHDKTIVKDVTGFGWSITRAAYDQPAVAVELLRKLKYHAPGLPHDPSTDAAEWIVVDRTGEASGADDFGRRVRNLPKPPSQSLADADVDGDVTAGWEDGHFNGIRLVDPDTGAPYDYWVPWARMTRSWGSDFNFNELQPDDDGDAVAGEADDSNDFPELIGVQPEERAPRFIVGKSFVFHSDRCPISVPPSLCDSADDSLAGAGQNFRGDMYARQTPPDEPWFRKKYRQSTPPSSGSLAETQSFERNRKPTFFTMNPVFEVTGGSPVASAGGVTKTTGPTIEDRYPDFNDPRFAYGRYFHYVDRSSSPIHTSLLFVANPGPSSLVPPGVGVPEKGLYRNNVFRHSLQMLQKDGDFEQVGELLNVWIWGHELKPTTVTYVGLADPVWQTQRTFSEYMVQVNEADPPGVTGSPTARVNRLQFGPVIGKGNPADLNDPLHSVPALPAGLRVLDAFVCDGPGSDAYVTDFNGAGGPALAPNGTVNDQEDLLTAERTAFRNAQGFNGKGTPGLINVNTAPPEVLRSLPQWANVIQEIYRLRSVAPVSGSSSAVSVTSSFRQHANHLPEAVVAYRESLDSGPEDLLPNYARPNATSNLMEQDRVGQGNGGPGNQPTGLFDELSASVNDLSDLRRQRGLASIGELLLAVNEPEDRAPGGQYLPATAPGFEDVVNFKNGWRMDMLGRVRFYDPATGPSLFPTTWTEVQKNAPVSAALSPDVVQPFDDSVTHYSGSGQRVPDKTARDSEELAMLFAGASNLITTRSDTFTVYFKIRSFRQDPVTGVWDATKKANIVDDSRYVMLVDRSQVNKPTDKPKILYIQKVPQ